MSYLKFKFFFSSDEDGTFWPGVVELPVEKEVTIDDPSIDETVSEASILDFHLSHRTNPNFSFEPNESTSKKIWR